MGIFFITSNLDGYVSRFAGYSCLYSALVFAELVAVSKRVPGHVVGDGVKTVTELVDIVNQIMFWIHRYITNVFCLGKIRHFKTKRIVGI